MISEKKYKTIKEVSELLDINMHVIRYWDSKFEGISIRLNEKKQRFFNHQNIKKLKELKNTLYNNGRHNYSLDLAKKILDKKIAENTNKKIDYSNDHQNELVSKLRNISSDLKKLIDF